MKKMMMSAHICINIVLLVIYIHYFGLPSIKKYVHKGVIIVMEEDKESQIISPGTLSDGYTGCLPAICKSETEK